MILFSQHFKSEALEVHFECIDPRKFCVITQVRFKNSLMSVLKTNLWFIVTATTSSPDPVFFHKVKEFVQETLEPIIVSWGWNFGEEVERQIENHYFCKKGFFHECGFGKVEELNPKFEPQELWERIQDFAQNLVASVIQQKPSSPYTLKISLMPIPYEVEA